LGDPQRPFNVIGYLDATTAPIRHRGVVAFAAWRAKELGADAIVALSHGTEHAQTISTCSAFTSGRFFGSGFDATRTGFSCPLVLGKASIIMIKWRLALLIGHLTLPWFSMSSAGIPPPCICLLKTPHGLTNLIVRKLSSTF
jgi:hypothetical protein